MKVLSLPIFLCVLMGLSSCALLRSATQLPIRTLQGVGRAVGLGVKISEVEGSAHQVAKDASKAAKGASEE